MAASTTLAAGLGTAALAEPGGICVTVQLIVRQIKKQ
jgi:hypothetical protein